MRFVSVRDLRSRGRQVWKQLETEKELIITSNGRPIAILTGVNQENFEQILRDLRRARALRAVEEMQRASVGAGLDIMSDKKIDTEIREARRARKR
ncbi:MAG: type II toxin-antitoxin system Phd/YefM family antitoxin [candidate division Zixibacteria bacterium]|nr:type II toxin-antitoxin system Phd/YefM family antitoxin [candidate division Zixibacteria bacterium]